MMVEASINWILSAREIIMNHTHSLLKMELYGHHLRAVSRVIHKKHCARMEGEGRIDFSGNEPRAKRYLSEVQKGQPPDVILSPEFVGFNAEGTSELRKIFGEGGVISATQTRKIY